MFARETVSAASCFMSSHISLSAADRLHGLTYITPECADLRVFFTGLFYQYTYITPKHIHIRVFFSLIDVITHVFTHILDQYTCMSLKRDTSSSRIMPLNLSIYVTPLSAGTTPRRQPAKHPSISRHNSPPTPSQNAIGHKKEPASGRLLHRLLYADVQYTIPSKTKHLQPPAPTSMPSSPK